MAWLYYRKAYGMCPIHGFWNVRMVGMAKNLITLIENSMENWKTGGTWDSRHQKRDLSRRLVIDITVCDHHDTTVT